MASGTALLRLGWVLALLAGPGAWAQEPQTAPSTPSTPRGPSVQWQLMVGAMSALDGYKPTGHQGLLLASGWELPSLRLRFQVLAGMPVWLRDERVEAKLEQYTVGMWLDKTVLRSGPLRWGVGTGAGVLVFSRTTNPLFLGVQPTNARFIPSFLVGPDTSVRWRLSQFFAVEGSAAVEAVFGRPIIGYLDDNGFQPLHRGWALRPRLSLAMVVLP